MTPPGAYVDGTVGIPLPGVAVRLGEHGELQFTGAYAARYLDEHGPPGSLPFGRSRRRSLDRHRRPVQEREGGYLEIVDRLKDIYKEQPGPDRRAAARRTALRVGARHPPHVLAGDHRDHNVLLVVVDRDDPVVARAPSRRCTDTWDRSSRRSTRAWRRTSGRAIRRARPRLRTRARELTPKGSLRRKVIAEHFAELIDTLYRSNHVDLTVDGLRVRIPRWFFRDLAVLENDIDARAGGLLNTRSRAWLPIVREADGLVRVGDLLYRVGATRWTSRVFARQPRLWMGNPSLVAFSPCKPGGRCRCARSPTRCACPRAASVIAMQRPTRARSPTTGSARSTISRCRPFSGRGRGALGDRPTGWPARQGR